MPSIHTSEDMPPAHFKLVQAALKGRVRQGVGGCRGRTATIVVTLNPYPNFHTNFGVFGYIVR